MSQRISTDALVLHRFDYGETSQIVVLYTLAAGSVRAIAKGSKRPKSPFGGALDSLGRGSVVYVDKPAGQLAILVECVVNETYPGLRRDLSAMRRAEYLAEILMALAPEQERQPDLFAAAVQGLDRLSSGGGVLALCAFEAQALRILGHAPRTSRCAACGHALPDSRRVAVSARLGGACCPACASRDGRRVEADRAALSLIATLGGGTLTHIERVQATPAQIADARRVLTYWTAHTIGRMPKTARYLPGEGGGAPEPESAKLSSEAGLSHARMLRRAPPNALGHGAPATRAVPL